MLVDISHLNAWLIIVVHAVGFMDEADVELFDSFLPRVGSSLTPPVLSDFKNEASTEVVSLVLKIIYPRCSCCVGELISPQSMEVQKLGSL